MEVPAQALQIPPRVLYFDVETALMKVDMFNLYVPGKYISWKNIERHSYVICWAAAWVPDDPARRLTVHSDSVTQREALRGDDRRALQGLWNLLDRADYVVGHNSNGFDIKKSNYRFIVNGMPAPTEYKQLDTLTMARKYFKSDSNALEFWSLRLGGEPKDDMDLDDWKRICLDGDPASLRKMERYCRGDVREGVGVYRKFKSWIESSGKKVYR